MFYLFRQNSINWPLINVINVPCKCNRGGAGGSVGSSIGGCSDNACVSHGVLVAVEEQVSKNISISQIIWSK